MTYVKMSTYADLTPAGILDMCLEVLQELLE